jgi:hypothetical protein
MKKLYTAIILVLTIPTFCLAGMYDPVVTTDYGDGTSVTYDGSNIVSSTQRIGDYTTTYDYGDQE